MKKTLKVLLAAILSIVTMTSASWAGKTPETRINDSIHTLKKMAQQEDSQSMGHIIGKGIGVAIFPSVVKAGFVFGGQYGEGLLLRRDKKTGQWYGPSFYNIAGGSWGLQIGVQKTALVLVITDEDGMKGFRGDNFTLGGDVAVAAGPVGRRTSAGTDINLNSPIYSYSMSKGLFAGLSLDGSAINHDESADKLYWKKTLTPEKALSMKANSKQIKPLIDVLNKLIKEGK